MTTEKETAPASTPPSNASATTAPPPPSSSSSSSSPTSSSSSARAAVEGSAPLPSSMFPQIRGYAEEVVQVELNPGAGPAELQTLCMQCGASGTTRLLLTKIPHFKELIIMAFECPECNCRNHEVSFGGVFEPLGMRQQLAICGPDPTSRIADLDRQIVKSDSATVSIPELDFEIPAQTQKGQINTIEGVLVAAIDDLQQLQPVRRITEPDLADKIDRFITQLQACKEGARPFTLIIDDPAGNSFIQNPNAPRMDPNLTTTHYRRTQEQNQMLGLRLPADSDAVANNEAPHETQHTDAHVQSMEKVPSLMSGESAAELVVNTVAEQQQVMTFPELCNNCRTPGELRMILTDIPHFKQVVLMAFSCDQCGYKSTDVKAGGSIPPKGRRITLKVVNPEDLNRDILKSETATVIIPELELEITQGSMGGVFTTIEGLMVKLGEQLKNSPTCGFSIDDSATNDQKSQFENFFTILSEFASGKREFTIIVDDPVSNSYVQNYFAPDPDPNMVVEEYDRTWEQNDSLGINDMKTDDYVTPASSST